MNILLSQVVGPGIVQWAIYIVILAAIVALVLLALRNFGISVPPFVVQAFWIVVIAVVVIFAIMMLVRLAGGV